MTPTLSSSTTTAWGDEKHLVRIFERFYRVGEGRTRVTGGSGLVSIVRTRCCSQGGIVAKNRAEGRPQFPITFPKNKEITI